MKNSLHHLLLLINYNTLSRCLRCPWCPAQILFAWPVLPTPSCCEFGMLIAHSCLLLWSISLSSWESPLQEIPGGHSLLAPTLRVSHGQWLTDTGIWRSCFTRGQLCGTIYTPALPVDKALAETMSLFSFFSCILYFLTGFSGDHSLHKGGTQAYLFWDLFLGTIPKITTEPVHNLNIVSYAGRKRESRVLTWALKRGVSPDHL